MTNGDISEVIFAPTALAGKVAVVTGGATGIGLGIVRSLSAAGASVLAVGRRGDGAEIIAINCPAAQYLQADLAEVSAPQTIIDEAVERFGSIDILVNNAAHLEYIPIADLTVEKIDAMTAVNVRAVLLLTQAFAAARQGRDGLGKIVNIGSIEGEVSPVPAGHAVYSATKTAVRGLTVTLARELGPTIGVNGIAPGAVMHADLLRHANDALKPEDFNAVLDEMAANTNVNRLGKPGDIGAVCVFLASAASDYVSGQTITADGGFSVR
ncbi:SDR family NAD(P)-dependent oxidoreductase [[Mycobacterium] vasticus]|uniref:SDR family oxidoreductase n=1 Tax=[Mycobacterium] vasticus TaxID=2875777 RepID=A0ABU5Z2P9_9MYCO|nr:SDR family oxidoreductase [Mycolicibacter sp. MYC017]MEB3071677.1 SDR family oxidoreductase [Mycolicibacter sp. MYC017]